MELWQLAIVARGAIRDELELDGGGSLQEVEAASKQDDVRSVPLLPGSN